MLDPRPVLRHDGIVFIASLQRVLAELHQFQLEKRQILSLQRAQFSLHRRMFGLDRRIRQIRALAQEQIRSDLALQHLDLRIVADRPAQPFRQLASVARGKALHHLRELPQVPIQPRILDPGIQNAQVPANLFRPFHRRRFHSNHLPFTYRIASPPPFVPNAPLSSRRPLFGRGICSCSCGCHTSFLKVGWFLLQLRSSSRPLRAFVAQGARRNCGALGLFLRVLTAVPSPCHSESASGGQGIRFSPSRLPRSLFFAYRAEEICDLSAADSSSAAMTFSHRPVSSFSLARFASSSPATRIDSSALLNRPNSASRLAISASQREICSSSSLRCFSSF